MDVGRYSVVGFTHEFAYALTHMRTGPSSVMMVYLDKAHRKMAPNTPPTCYGNCTSHRTITIDGTRSMSGALE